MVVLAFDLEFGLEFLDQQFEARDFGTEFVNVGSGCAWSMSLRRVLLLWRLRRLRVILLGKSFGQGARPDGVGWPVFGVRGRRSGYGSRWKRRGKNGRGARRRGRRGEKAVQGEGRNRLVEMERLCVFGGVEKIADAADEFLGLKRFADKFVGLDGDGAIGDGFVDYAGHENDGSFGELRILFDLAANRVAILIRHDDIRDDDIRWMLFELVERGGGVGASDH